MTPTPSAILFDMDGTLTLPVLNFDLIRREMGLNENESILTGLSRLTGSQKNHAQAVLLKHEQHAALTCPLSPGCHALLDTIDSLSIPRALITRNSMDSVQAVLSRHRLSFPVIITRDCAPPKPLPDPLHLALTRLSIPPAHHPRAWMIGDGEYDIQAGHAARLLTIWLNNAQHTSPPSDTRPHLTVHTLDEIRQLLLLLNHASPTNLSAHKVS